MMYNKEEDICNDFRKLNKEGKADQEIYQMLSEDYMLTEATIKKICKVIKNRFHICKFEGCNKQFEVSKLRISPLYTDYCAEHREKVKKPWKFKEKKLFLPGFSKRSAPKEHKVKPFDTKKCHRNCGEEFEYDRNSSICRNCTVISRKKHGKTLKENKVIDYIQINYKAVKAAHYAGVEI